MLPSTLLLNAGRRPFTITDACCHAPALLAAAQDFLNAGLPPIQLTLVDVLLNVLLVAQDFLNAGPPPIYIGFGSLVVDNPAQLTRRFIKALK